MGKEDRGSYPYQSSNSEGFLGGSVIKNSLANSGDMNSIPGLGGSHVLVGQLSLCITTIEPTHPRARAWQQERPQQ